MPHIVIEFFRSQMKLICFNMFCNTFFIFSILDDIFNDKGLIDSASICHDLGIDFRIVFRSRGIIFTVREKELLDRHRALVVRTFICESISDEVLEIELPSREILEDGESLGVLADDAIDIAIAGGIVFEVTRVVISPRRSAVRI